MQGFLLSRLAISMPTLLIVTVLVFGLQSLLPGDIALVLAGEENDPAGIAFIREKYRLDDPVPIRYLAWLVQVVQGDLGHSIKTQIPVTDLILQKLPVTAQLAFWSMLVALLIGIPAGIIAAVKKGTALDHTANAVGLAGLSIPNFWLGIMLIMVVAVEWGALPPGGYTPPTESLADNLAGMIMPAFVLGSGIAAVFMRHTRSAMLSALTADYVRTARAKGLFERTVIVKHALRNALVPVITLGALELGQLFSGAVLTETVFNIPGFGRLVVEAVFNRDYAVVQGVVLFTATAYILLNLLADLLYALVNPRLRG
ncbi:MAG: ABC transporter permease [Alphaproteobacteria bacterium]|nr:ABC transporter permease [Alphaproteobacteria bacterium]